MVVKVVKIDGAIKPRKAMPTILIKPIFMPPPINMVTIEAINITRQIKRRKSDCMMSMNHVERVVNAFVVSAVPPLIVAINSTPTNKGASKAPRENDLDSMERDFMSCFLRLNKKRYYRGKVESLPIPAGSGAA